MKKEELWPGDGTRHRGQAPWHVAPWRELSPAGKEPLSDGQRAGLGLPRTFRVLADPGAAQRVLFDPATKQFDRSFRASDPQFRQAGDTDAWRRARRDAAVSVLRGVENSPWSGNLILRGSVLLKSWLGAAAREPGDLDFVVAPADWHVNDYSTRQLLAGVAEAAERACSDSPVTLDAARTVIESIWTYDRVPGLRLLLPWSTAGDGPSGDLQLDFVFGERLPVEPELTEIRLSGDGRKALVFAASPALSLAWKVLWLITDAYPQAKDLYDAVLLAERVPLPYELLINVVAAADPYYGRRGVPLSDIAGLDVDFTAFHADHPDLRDFGPELVQRLAAALAPAFTSARTGGG